MDSLSYIRYNGYWNCVSDFGNSLYSRLRDYGEFLLYSSLFLGLAATSMAYTSCFIQGISWTSHIAMVMFLVVFSVYNLNRKTDEAEDALNHEHRFRITKKFERQFFIAALGAYLTALSIAAFHGITAFCVVSIPLISGIFYSVPVLPKWVGYHRLKEIPVMKNLVVSTSWALAFSLVPVYLSDSAPDAASMLVFLFIFCWTFVASVLPDIRDRSGDSATGVATIPVLVGVERSRSIPHRDKHFSGSHYSSAGNNGPSGAGHCHYDYFTCIFPGLHHLNRSNGKERSSLRHHFRWAIPDHWRIVYSHLIDAVPALLKKIFHTQ